MPRLHYVPRYRSSRPPALPLLLAGSVGLVLIGAMSSQQLRRRQLARIGYYPDDAPLPARRSRPEPGALIARSVTIGRPRSEVYGFWRDFANLPRFMENVQAVEPGEAGRMVWTIAAPVGGTLKLVSEITEERDGELLAWRSAEGSEVEAEGRVTFADAPGGRGTVVRAEIAYRLPGGRAGRIIAALFQKDPATQGRRELKRLKMLMETGEIATANMRRQTA